jgi:hypothetical protein
MFVLGNNVTLGNFRERTKIIKRNSRQVARYPLPTTTPFSLPPLYTYMSLSSVAVTQNRTRSFAALLSSSSQSQFLWKYQPVARMTLLFCETYYFTFMRSYVTSLGVEAAPTHGDEESYCWLHCKKRLAVFPYPAGMSITKLSLAGNKLIMGTGKPFTLFTVYTESDNPKHLLNLIYFHRRDFNDGCLDKQYKRDGGRLSSAHHNKLICQFPYLLLQGTSLGSLSVTYYTVTSGFWKDRKNRSLCCVVVRIEVPFTSMEKWNSNPDHGHYSVEPRDFFVRRRQWSLIYVSYSTFYVSGKNPLVILKFFQ